MILTIEAFVYHFQRVILKRHLTKTQIAKALKTDIRTLNKTLSKPLNTVLSAKETAIYERLTRL